MMRISLAILVAATAALPSAAWAQDAPEDLSARVTAIEQKLDELIANHNAILENERQLRSEATQRDERLQGIELRVDALIANDEKMITSLESLSQQSTELSGKLDKIALGGGGSSSGLLSLEGLAEKKEAFFGATNGKLEVHNRMTDWKELHINGQEWKFPPGVSSITVPYGPVHAKLNGGERFEFSHQHWATGPGGHILRMEITNMVPQPGWN